MAQKAWPTTRGPAGATTEATAGRHVNKTLNREAEPDAAPEGSHVRRRPTVQEATGYTAIDLSTRLHTADVGIDTLSV